MHIAQTTVVDRPQIEQLLDTAFGPDRQQKSAYRLREGSRPVEWVAEVLAARDRKAGGPTAPPGGLYFAAVRRVTGL